MLYVDAKGVIMIKPVNAGFKPLKIVGAPPTKAAPTAPAPKPEEKKEVSSEISGNNEYDNAPPVNFTYQGGLTLKTPILYNIFLGDWSSADKVAMSGKLNQFSQDILKSNWMNTLSEYNYSGKGQFVKGLNLPNSNRNLDEPSIHNFLQAAIDSKAIPEGTNDINTENLYLIFLDDATAVQDNSLGITMCEAENDNAFGYHSSFVTRGGKNVFYAIIPSLSDDCLQKACKGGACSLKVSDTQLDRVTQVASHELAEAVTNPNAQGWFDVKTGNEIGDICNAKSAKIKVGDNTWQVQKQYSKAADIATNGSGKCVSGEASGTGGNADSGSAIDYSDIGLKVVIGASIIGSLWMIFQIAKAHKKNKALKYAMA